MSDGSTFLMEPADHFGTANKDLIMVLNPFREGVFQLRAKVKKGTVPAVQGEDPSIDNVFLTGQYMDKKNKADLNVRFEWDPPASSTSGLASADPWKYTAVYNPEGAYYIFNGLITYSDGSCYVNELYLQPVQGQLMLSPTDEPYSVEIDGQLVDWKIIDKVAVFLFQSADSIATSAAELLFTPGSTPDLPRLKVFNALRYPLLKPQTQDADKDARYYLIQRPRSDPSISFYYNATYIHADGTVKYTGEIEVENQFVLVLPADGEESKPALRQHVITFQAMSETA